MAVVDHVEADEVNDELKHELIRRQRSKYVEIHNLHEYVGCDLRKTPTTLHMREAAGEGLLMWQVSLLMKHAVHICIFSRES